MQEFFPRLGFLLRKSEFGAYAEAPSHRQDRQDANQFPLPMHFSIHELRAYTSQWWECAKPH